MSDEQREILDHQIDAFNTFLVKVSAVDGPGPGGASHLYRIHLNLAENATLELTDISFQKGPVKEAGVNGLTEASLLAIVLDRLRAFQRAQYGCRQNALAITHIEDALHWMRDRGIERDRRAVEGTSKV